MTPDNRIDVGQLRQRLRAWVAHESMSSRRALEETWAQSVAERVDGGYCAAGLRLASARNGSFAFDCREFAAKFREGEPLYLGGGTDIDAGWPVTFLGYDVATGRVRVAPDRFESREPMKPEPGEEYCLDRRGLGLERLLLEGLDSVFHKENAHTIEALTGRLGLALDDARHAAALAHGQQIGFTPAQSEALARATATEGLCLIQGPPGTGKTRVLAEAAVLLARRGCRLFVTGLTHRAVHNVLLAVRAIEPRVPVFKVGSRNRAEGLEGSGIATVRNLEHFAFPEGASIVGGTPFAVRRFSADRRFHFVLLDEAGQMPVVHGAIAMTQARRWVVVGDPKQLRPVFEGEGRDPLLARSLYSYLEDFGEGVLLDRTFRMNETLAGFASREFYEDRLDSADSARERELALVDGGPLRDILDPKKPLVIARVDHEGRRRRSPEEAELIVELVRTLRQHHAIPASEIAIIAPFRSQVRLLRYELERQSLFTPDLVVDTVERMQGQEREVVILSMSASDRDYLERQAHFYFDPGRLNVSLTRARTKCIVVGSRHAFRARPHDLEHLLAAARFKRLCLTAPNVIVEDDRRDRAALVGVTRRLSSPPPAAHVRPDEDVASGQG